MTDQIASRSSDFKVNVSTQSPGYSSPQKLGRRLWAPMWLMAIAAFPAAFIVGLVRSAAISEGAAETSILSLHHTQAGIMFIGFATAFAAISFAIARILGEFRKGGGEVQALVSTEVVTVKPTPSAKVFILGMMMAMVAILAASLVHFAWAARLSGGAVSLSAGEEAFVILEAVRRLGVAVYLVSIMSGLVTIGRVLHFQAVRIRELAAS